MSTLPGGLALPKRRFTDYIIVNLSQYEAHYEAAFFKINTRVFSSTVPRDKDPLVDNTLQGGSFIRQMGSNL